jgi:anti-anti-sigma factor
MEKLQVSIEPGKSRGTSIVRLAGPLTLATQFHLEDALRQIAGADTIIDVFDTPYIDSAGLGTILAHWSLSQQCSSKFALTGVSKRIQMLLELTRVNTVLPVFRTPDDAELMFSAEK